MSSKIIEYTPQGVCSRHIEVTVEDGIVQKVRFSGGCNGNTKGIASLVEGMRTEDVVSKLKGLTCHGKASSCPDQLAKALEQK